MNQQDRLLRARVAIMREPRFIALSGIMMTGDCIVADGLHTAATNGRDVLVGRQFIDTLDDATLRFVVLHEYYHVLYLHMITWKHLWDEDPNTANLAADAVINLQLDKLAGKGADNWLTVWPHAILDHQYEGMDTGEVYRRMKQQRQQQKSQRSASGGKAQPMDEHRPAKSAPGDSGSRKSGEALGAPEATEVAKAVDTAIRQAVIAAGKMGANVDRSIKDLLEVTVDWRDQLKDFYRTHAAGSDMSTWRKPSRRWMAQDAYMPSRISETMKRVVITCDTSGSIGEAQLRRAMSEIVGACETVKPEIVDMIYWDTTVAAHEVYEGDAVTSIADVTKPKGGGGTDPTSVSRYLAAKGIKPDCIIHFTDGYVGKNWGEWNAPVLWCISTKGITAPCGVSLYVPA